MDDTIENQENWVDWGTLSMKKVSRNQFVVSGDFEFKLNMADEQKVSDLKYIVYIPSSEQLSCKSLFNNR